METPGDIIEAVGPKREKVQDWKKRETWKREADFLIALIGGCVGFGNVWRFPYLCYKNGGGAFLIPYFLSVIFCGLPLYYLEMAVGQYMGHGGLKAWNIVPLFQGIGLASLIITFMFSCYYNVILTWVFYYLFASFTPELPWQNCGHEWNTPNCSEGSSSLLNSTAGSAGQTSDPVNEFWENKVLHISSGLSDPGNVKWDLFLCLLLAWIVVYVCLCKGIKSSGKVMYVTATSPYIFMLILLIRNCTLDGSVEGIRFYLQVNMTKLSESAVWVEAGTQVFYSWALCVGAITAYGSYNKFHHNSLRDAVALTVVNASTSFLAGFIVFSNLGFMAKENDVLISDVAESGPGLAFIAYPKAVAQLPISPLWSVLFFMMMAFIGLDTQFLNVEPVITAVVDQYPSVLRKGYRKELFVGIICIVMFLIGITMVTEGGMYVLQMFDYFFGSRIIMVIAISEITAVSCCYGVRRFLDNIQMMIGKTSMTGLLFPYLRFTWVFSTPVFSVAFLAMIIHHHSDLTYKRPNHPKYIYPDWSMAIGWMMAVLIIIWVPLVALHKVMRFVWIGGSLTREDLRLLIVPYSLSEHQRRPEDRDERCLKMFEEKRGKDYNNFQRFQEKTHIPEEGLNLV